MFPRKVTALACLAMCCVASAEHGRRQQADPKITLTLPAMTMANALRQLSTAVQAPFAASPQTANDIVTLRFKDVPLSEAMKRLAGAVDGTWKQEGDLFRLIRTADQVREERSHEFSQDEQRFRESIEKLTAEQAKMPAWSSAEAETLANQAEVAMRGFNRNTPSSSFYQKAWQILQSAPSGRLLPRIAALFDPKELAGLTPFYKTVWSTSPTAMQRPMPHDVLNLLDQFIRDQSVWNEAVNRHNLADITNTMGSWFRNQGGERDQAQGKVTKVLLSATTWAPGSGINLTISAYDEQGRRLGQSQLSLGAELLELPKTANVETTAAEEPRIIPQGDARLLLNALGQTGGLGQPLPQELRDRLVAPERNDPLSFLASPPLIQAAEIKNVNMVACLSDASIFGALLGTVKDVPVNRFLERLKLFQLSSELKDGWLVVKPTRPNEARIYRADRDELGKYLQRLSLPNPLTIDESAHFALNLPERQLNALPSSMISLLHVPAETNFNLDMLRLYGLMTVDQRRVMANGGMLLSALNEAELGYVDRMVYGANASLQYMGVSNQRRGLSIETSDWMLYSNGLLSEPTESLPTGIPRQGRLTLTGNDSFVVVPSGSTNTSNAGGARMLNPQSLAWQQFMQERPDLFPWVTQQGQRVDLANIEYGQQLQLTFRFDLSPVLTMTQSLEGRGTSDFQRVTLDSLPDDFKKKFDQAYQNYKKSYANVNAAPPSFPPGQVPPPAP